MGVNNGSGADHADVLDLVRSSDCATMQRDSISSMATAPSGSGAWLGKLAVSRIAQTYTQIRFEIGTTAPGGTYTDVRAAVTDFNGIILQQTANAVGTVIAANTLYTLPLLAAVTLTQGQRVYLGLAFVATTLPSFAGRGLTGLSLINSLPPKQIVSTAGVLVTGNPMTDPGVAGGQNTGPWVELIP